MLAASYWSLLAPAIDMVTEAYGPWSFVPVSVGFIAGGLFVYLADLFMNACVSYVMYNNYNVQYNVHYCIVEYTV